MTKRIKLDLIRLDGGTQPRAEIDSETVSVYADAIENGDPFPPVDVFYDGEYYWLADGFHRVHANKQVGYAELDCNVHQGTRRDAVLFAVGANREHGLRRTNADKRRAVNTLLNDKEWAKWSDREIARECHVSADLVAAMRPKVTIVSDSEVKTYTTKHGTQATMNTANIGRSPRLTVEPNIPTARDEGETNYAPAPRRTPLIPKEEHEDIKDYDPDFASAWNALFIELQNVKANKWETVPKHVAQKYIQLLLNIVNV